MLQELQSGHLIAEISRAGNRLETMQEAFEIFEAGGGVASKGVRDPPSAGTYGYLGGECRPKSGLHD